MLFENRVAILVYLQIYFYLNRLSTVAGQGFKA